MLAITRWVDAAAARHAEALRHRGAALERRGVAEPGRQLALIRGWKTATLLVKNGAFTAAEIAAHARRSAARARSTPSIYPGMRPEEANRYNVLDRS